MTAALPHAIGRRLPALLALLVLVATSACRQDAKARSSGRAGSAAAGTTTVESAGEVVIAAPDARYAAGPVASPGTVSGVVATSAPLAPDSAVATGKDAAVCGPAIADSSVQQHGTGLGNAVVWLEGVRTGKPVPLEKRLELESDHCILIPRVQTAMTGGAVNVLAHEDLRQHLRFMAGGEREPRATILLGKDEQVIPTELPVKAPGLVIVHDGDHPWVRGYIAVFDHPYATVTKPDGSFSLDQVPPGTYTLVAWHERTGRTEQRVTVPANGTVKVTMDMKSVN